MLRVVLSGVESVGKSTLAAMLAKQYRGLLVPEFGRSYTERLRRQQDTLHTLRPLVAQQAPAAAVQTALHALRERMLVSPDPAYRAYMEQLEQEACATFAALHNSTTPAQRLKAADTLSRYEQDLRVLAGSRL